MLKLALHDDLLVILTDSVAVPGADTTCLAAYSDRIACRDTLVVGCGAGLLALRLARRGVRVHAIDINPEAVRLCQRNAVVNDLSDRVMATVTDATTAADLGPFDLVISNPPQLPTAYPAGGASWVRLANDGGPGGRDFIEWLCRSAAGLLRPAGVLLFTHFGFLEPEATAELLRRDGFEVRVEYALTKSAGILSGERLARLGTPITEYGVYIVEARRLALPQETKEWTTTDASTK
ncbi:methyltransferase [Micromonospora sp. CPCC 206061]|uniref:methyltransferase n=1 Tax=Micromonospora sp. CPCC 206061 TaxID=3122410 RepID=UPI002FF34F1C